MFTPSEPAGTHFSFALAESRPGISIIHIEGKNATKLFNGEAGGHRWQRVSPTERKGRTHTSSITVAVLKHAPEVAVTVRKGDITWQATRGSGAGGQHRNKTSSAVQIWHKESGVQVRAENSKSQWQNRQAALDRLQDKIEGDLKEKAETARNTQRREQVGSGQRGDKIRTVRIQDDTVIDHAHGWRMSARKYLSGDW